MFRTAVLRDIESILALLVAAGADVSAKDNTGLTPLDYALEVELKDAIEFLRTQNEN